MKRPKKPRKPAGYSRNPFGRPRWRVELVHSLIAEGPTPLAACRDVLLANLSGPHRYLLARVSPSGDWRGRADIWTAEVEMIPASQEIIIQEIAATLPR